MSTGADVLGVGFMGCSALGWLQAVNDNKSQDKGIYEYLFHCVFSSPCVCQVSEVRPLEGLSPSPVGFA